MLFQKKPRYNKRQLYHITETLLRSSMNDGCCRREIYRTFDKIQGIENHCLTPIMRRRLNEYRCVVYTQRILYPLRYYGRLDVRILPEAMRILSCVGASDVYTYKKYNQFLETYLIRELERLPYLFGEMEETNDSV